MKFYKFIANKAKSLPIKKIFLGLILSLLLLIIVWIFYWFFNSYQTLVLLQNTDEKRATGGFLGSIAVVSHRGLKINHWQIYDIYESDGQIKEFIEAPWAVQQYLNNGRPELHLPDANWERDFPSSAKNIIELFSRAGRPKPDFVISLNLTTVEKIVDRIAGLNLERSLINLEQEEKITLAELKEEATTEGEILLTGSNLAQVLRAQRDDFFPGDRQKTTSLRPVAQALQQKIQQLSLKGKLELIKFILQEIKEEQLYFFSSHPFKQKLFSFLNLSGETQQAKNCQQIYFVESNIGVNKSNRLVKRQIQTQVLSNGDFFIQVDWQNNNPLPATAASLPAKKRWHYANYQRLLLPPAVELVNTSFNQQPITTIDERIITDSSGELWHEQGFLLVINEETSGHLSLLLRATKKSPVNCWRVDFN